MTADLSFFAPWMLVPSLAVIVVAILHKRYLFKPNSGLSAFRQLMVVFILYELPGISAIFFAVLSAANLASRWGYLIHPLLTELVFYAGCFGFTMGVIRSEVRSVARKRQTHDA